MRQLLRRGIRKCLGAVGLVALRPQAATMDLSAYLATQVGREGRSQQVYCCDSDLQVEGDLLGLDPAPEALVFSPDADVMVRDLQGSSSSAPAIVLADLEAGLKATQLTALASHPVTCHLILRATYGYFWSGDGDLLNLIAQLGPAQFCLCKVLSTRSLSSPRSPLESLSLAFARLSPAWTASRGVRAAAGVAEEEATCFLSKPVPSKLTRVGGRGLSRYSSGLLNPGVVDDSGDRIIVARAESRPWSKQKQDERVFMESASAVFARLKPDEQLAQIADGIPLRMPAHAGSRAEDFRLFSAGGAIYSNYAVTSGAPRSSGQDRRLSAFELTTRLHIAKLDPGTPSLSPLGSPSLDLPLTRVEKNWAMFEYQGSVHLIYSFNPYRLCTADRWPSLDFSVQRTADLDLPYSLSRELRNSVNPVHYDDEHLLHVVHTVFPTKSYVFWGVLIRKDSLLPVAMSFKPLLAGWRSAPAAIIYVTSVIAGKLDIELFGNVNDCSIGHWRIARADLDLLWQPITLQSIAQ